MVNNDKKMKLLCIILVIVLLISVIINIILIQYQLNNKNKLNNINEIISSKSIIEYSNKYLPYIISNFHLLNTLKMQYNVEERIDNIHYINTISEAIQNISAYNAIISIPVYYENDNYLFLSITINTFLLFLNDFQNNKIEFILNHSQSLQLIFENIFSNIENDKKIYEYCIQLIEIIHQF